jgi:hypothetical protein
MKPELFIIFAPLKHSAISHQRETTRYPIQQKYPRFI